MIPLTGYRRLAIAGNAVYSPIQFDYQWGRGWNECDYRNPFYGTVCHEQPTENNQTGLYAFFDYSLAWKYNISYHVSTVVVKVEGAGVVVEHETGFRSQFMRVTAVDEIGGHPPCEFAAWYFDVPIVRLVRDANPDGWKLPATYWKE